MTASAPKGQTMNFETKQIDCAGMRKGDRFRQVDGEYRNTVDRVEVFDNELVHVWIEGQERNASAWLVLTGTDKITIARPTPPAADEMFDAIEATDAAAEQFERDPQNRGSIEPAARESREVGSISVDVHGPWDRPVFEVGRWDTEEGAFVHVVSLTRDEADALHTALGRTLLG